MNRVARWCLLLTPVVAASVGLEGLGRTYASTRDERRAPMPGDGLVSSPQIVITRAITIPAAPQEVWPWLAQVGWHRGGWYTARWVDQLLFRQNLPCADRLIEEFQGLRLGDFIPDGPPATHCGFVVLDLVAPERLVLHSATHLPLSWRVRDRARVSWTWVFVLIPVDKGRSTRLVFRWRARTWPWWLTLAAQLVIVPADLVMSHDMLHGIRDRVVRETARGRRWGTMRDADVAVIDRRRRPLLAPRRRSTSRGRVRRRS